MKGHKEGAKAGGAEGAFRGARRRGRGRQPQGRRSPRSGAVRGGEKLDIRRGPFSDDRRRRKASAPSEAEGYAHRRCALLHRQRDPRPGPEAALGQKARSGVAHEEFEEPKFRGTNVDIVSPQGQAMALGIKDEGAKASCPASGAPVRQGTARVQATNSREGFGDVVVDARRSS